MDNITLWMFFLLALVSSHKADELSNIQDNVITDYSQDIGSSLQGELPFNQEVNVYLPGPQTKRLYFHHHKRKFNVSLTITPCDSPIRFEIYHVNTKILKRYFKKKLHRRSKSEYIRLINRKFLNNANRNLLFNKTIAQRFMLEEYSMRPGLYIIELTPIDDSELSIKLYMSTYGSPYPKIPPVATILSKQIFVNDDIDEIEAKQIDGRNASVDIWWNPVIDIYEQTEYDYCLMISVNKHYHDNCMLCSEINELSADSGLNMQEKLNIYNFFGVELNSESYWKYVAVKLLHKQLFQKRFKESVVYFKCHNQTKTTVHNLKPNMVHYVNVFARNKWNNLTSPYWTSNFTLSAPDEDESSTLTDSSRQLLHDSLYTGVFLESKNKYRKRFFYKINSENANKVYVFIQPCSGIGPIQFMIRQAFIFDYRRKRHNEKLNLDSEIIFVGTHDEESNDEGILFFDEITETKTIELTLPSSNSNETNFLEFEISTVAHQNSRRLILLASSVLSKFPFPRLPTERSIRSMETIRKCDSLTLVWNASPDERVIYCLLQRNADFDNAAFVEPKDLCDKLMPLNPNKRALEDEYLYDDRYTTPTRKVMCRRYKSSKRRLNKNLIMQEVRKLSPGRQYVFQVEITKGRGRRLHYEQVFAETKPESQCNSDENRFKRKDRWNY